MLFAHAILALTAALLTSALPLERRWYPSGSCVTDVKIELCSTFGCEVSGYHRIDTMLTQRPNMTSESSRTGTRLMWHLDRLELRLLQD